MSTVHSSDLPATTKLKEAGIKLKRVIGNNDLLLALIVAVIMIIGGVGLGRYNNKVVLTNPSPIARYSREPSNQLSFLSNWDGPDYLKLARLGYGNTNEANFFPLYPLLIRAVHSVIPSLIYSALLISWISLVAATYFFIKILRILFKVSGTEGAVQGLLLFLLFPTSVFLLATYTESLFSALALGALYYALKKNYLAAALFTLFCTATHITGLFVLALIPLVLWEEKVHLTKIAITTALGSIGLLSYMYFLNVRFSKPLAFITSQKKHGWLAGGGYHNLFTTVDFFNVIFIILLIASIIYWWPRRKSFALYSFLFLCIPLVGKQFGGFNRYVLVAFPLPLMLYGITRNKKPIYYSVLIAIFAISWTYFLMQYAGGYIGG